VETIKTLRNLFSVQAGTLFRGLYISNNGNVFLSTKQWYYEQKKHVKGLWSTTDRDTVSFEYVPDSFISNLLRNKKISICDNSEMDFIKFSQNGIAIFPDLTKQTMQEVVMSEDCVGMSLGDNIIFIRPFHTATYRPGFYDIYLFHKVLHKDSIKWVVLQSNSIGKNLVLHNPDDLLLEIEMKLV